MDLSAIAVAVQAGREALASRIATRIADREAFDPPDPVVNETTGNLSRLLAYLPEP